MDQELAPPRRRLGAAGMMLRRRRIFARLREGLSYDEIAAEEGVTGTRSGRSSPRSCSSGRSTAAPSMRSCNWTASLPVMQLAAEAVAAGDVSAITPYLKVLDRLDRYQTVASANQVYDDEARKKLIDKINRVAANLGVDEVLRNAAREHLKKIGDGRRQGRGDRRGKPDRRA